MKKIIIISILTVISVNVRAQAWNPEDAAAYAKFWCNGKNPKYNYYQGADCANFVSQCLKEGGLNLSKGAPGMGLPNNGVDDKGCIPNASALVIHLANWQDASIFVSEKGFKPPSDHGVGDPMFEAAGATGIAASHSLICSTFDWKRLYSTHTNDHCDADWPNNIPDISRLIFFHIRSNINDHCINKKFEPELGEQGLDCGGEDCPPCACNPAHCCNGQFEPELGELGFDCGGTCPDECPPLPDEPCLNCQQDPDEENIDCGGDECSPCDDVLNEKIITSTTKLRKEIMAFNKIKTIGYVFVESGMNVSFITEEQGTIVLQPGFKAEKGCTFKTQRREDLSGCSRACGTICKLDYISKQICFPECLRIYQLINAVRVDCYIYDKASGDRKYEKSIYITSNDEIYELWNCVAGVGIQSGTVWYIIEYYVYCCDGTYYKKVKIFLLIISVTNRPTTIPTPPKPLTQFYPHLLIILHFLMKTMLQTL